MDGLLVILVLSIAFAVAIHIIQPAPPPQIIVVHREDDSFDRLGCLLIILIFMTLVALLIGQH